MSSHSKAPATTSQSATSSALPYKEEMETAFGEDFSDVSVEFGPTPGANAYARGNNIQFADPAPSKETVAHELTHVVQARQAGTEDQAAPTMAESKVSNPEGAAETEAASVAARVASGGEAGSVSKAPEPGAVHREAVTMAGLTLASATWGSALAATTIGEAASIIGAVGSGSAAAVNALAPGANGVSAVTLNEKWISDPDAKTLEMIIQYRLINAYVDQWLANHPEVSASPAGTTAPAAPATGTAPAPAPATGTAPAAAPATTAPAPTTAPAAAPAAEGASVSTAQYMTQVESAVMAVVKAQVERQVVTAITAATRRRAADFYWADSGYAGTSSNNEFGTIGHVHFGDVGGFRLFETAGLNANARRVPGMAGLAGGDCDVRGLRGGMIAQGTGWQTGSNDSLTVNFNNPNYQDDGGQGHGLCALRSTWIWDGGTSAWNFQVDVGADGSVNIGDEGRQGSPDDWGTW